MTPEMLRELGDTCRISGFENEWETVMYALHRYMALPLMQPGQHLTDCAYRRNAASYRIEEVTCDPKRVEELQKIQMPPKPAESARMQYVVLCLPGCSGLSEHGDDRNYLPLDEELGTVIERIKQDRHLESSAEVLRSALVSLHSHLDEARSHPGYWNYRRNFPAIRKRDAVCPLQEKRFAR
jgi:hypothetical protein